MFSVKLNGGQIGPRCTKADSFNREDIGLNGSLADAAS